MTIQEATSEIIREIFTDKLGPKFTYVDQGDSKSRQYVATLGSPKFDCTNGLWDLYDSVSIDHVKRHFYTVDHVISVTVSEDITLSMIGKDYESESYVYSFDNPEAFTHLEEILRTHRFEDITDVSEKL